MNSRSWLTPPRIAIAVGTILFASSLLFFMWTWQQLDLELARPSPALLAILAVASLVGSAVGFGWAAGWKRRAKAAR